MKTNITPRYSFAGLRRIFVLTAIIMAAGFSKKSFAQARAPWVTPKIAQEIKNPFTGDKALLADAKILYVTNCAPCHGTKGRGDGPAAAALTPRPADHSSANVQSETDGSLFWKLSEGRNPMPSYKTMLTDKQRWALVNYIRTLAKNPVAK